MKAGVLHCRCAKCFSLPVRKRVRKRPSALTLLSLPEELLLYVLQCLSAEDLLAIRAVHSHLRDIIDSNSSVWTRVSFKDRWPATDTVWLFERAAEKGNFEAAVKLGIAYLYNEGPSLSEEGRADLCGRMASRYFSLAESLRSPLADPFIWLFIRPPWSMSGGCCKAVVYDRLKAECDTNLGRKGTLLHCLARVLQLFDDEEKRVEAVALLKESADCGNVQSSYLLWELNRGTAMADPGRYLQCVRTLRDYAAKGCWEAQLSFAKSCGTSNPLGLEPRACAELVAQFFLSGPKPMRRPQHLQGQDITTKRYILVDWLVEVTTMKDFSSQALHVTIGCVDRYLGIRSVPKAQLQLLGIACMVISTRYISKEILTIREAVWLTDNTYQYEDLVRMMGEVISVLDGKIRTPTVLDYGEVLLSLLPMERRSTHLFSYICELSLLCSPLTVPGPARLASAILLLTRALHNYVPVWPTQLEENTGFSKQDLVSCALSLYIKCFGQDVPKDYRHVSLTGVNQRFEDDAYQQISKETVMCFKELCQVLEVPEVEPQMEAPSASGQLTEIHTFLSSPASNSKRRREDSMQVHRGSFLATPTAELSTQEETLLGDILDWSLDTSCSGYEGDQESEGEKDGEVSVMEVQVELPIESGDLQMHCCAISSDDDSLSEEINNNNEDSVCGSSSSRSRPWQCHLSSSSCSSCLFCTDRHSSGYSSIQSVPSPSVSTSVVPSIFSPPGLTQNSASGFPLNSASGFRLLLPPVQRTRRQVKRKNTAAHSGGEAEGGLENEDDAANVAFLSL
ncbi:cyclin-F-like [Myxocyprinus asiaticus]|uniref:cyclin-F-like n=1 Tax=Myxocyprinus asiaticus TaxID=70543 RepID=UPI0022217405|nr:cyclin-F-like [Myxocyprinus asiaticus]